MPVRNNTLKYGSVAKTFHWLMALLIIGLVIVGWVLDGMAPSPDKLQLVGLHKSVGIVVLLLAAIRLMWKLANPSPLLPYHMKHIEKFAARAGHALLYFFMFAMPLSGWAMSSAAGYTVSVFGWATLPNLLDPNPELRGFFRQAHGVMGWGLAIMVSLHVLAALLHHFHHKNNILLRMVPYGKLRKEDYQRSDTMAGC